MKLLPVLPFALFLLANLVGAQGTENEPQLASPANQASARPTGNIALLHASLEERLKLGYGVDGWGPRGSPELYNKTENELRAMADAGDASAAHFLWTYYQGEGETSDLSTVRIAEMEELALDQFRRTGQTFLIYLVALRYQDVPGYQTATAAWYSLGAELGDPVCVHKAKRIQSEYEVDRSLVDSQVEELLGRIRQPKG